MIEITWSLDRVTPPQALLALQASSAVASLGSA
jgi:hypothetical protein